MALDILFVMGCTGSGKGALGRALARRMNGEIVSVDSMKVYRRMDIGTAKPGAVARAEVPHHLLDIREPWEAFSVAEFVGEAERAGREIRERGKRVLAVGGTALYIKALSEGLFEGPSADEAVRGRLRARAASEGSEALHAALAMVDPEAAARIHRNDLRRIVRALEVYELTGSAISALQTQWDRDRPRFQCQYVGIRRSVEDQNHRTNLRVRRLVEMGWAEECRELLGDARGLSVSARQALGYGEMFDYVEGRLALEEAVERIKIATRQFAKSQRTWLKRFRDVAWVEVGPDDDVEDVADRVMDRLEQD